MNSVEVVVTSVPWNGARFADTANREPLVLRMVHGEGIDMDTASMPRMEDMRTWVLNPVQRVELPATADSVQKMPTASPDQVAGPTEFLYSDQMPGALLTACSNSNMG